MKINNNELPLNVLVNIFILTVGAFFLSGLGNPMYFPAESEIFKGTGKPVSIEVSSLYFTISLSNSDIPEISYLKRAGDWQPILLQLQNNMHENLVYECTHETLFFRIEKGESCLVVYLGFLGSENIRTKEQIKQALESQNNFVKFLGLLAFVYGLLRIILALKSD